MPISLGHVTVRSADFERTERFQGDLPGLRIGQRPAIALPGRWFYIGDPDGARIELSVLIR
jgi:catechol 2,3-dioxygenase-like lactoylglutathione lyase family enzyme